MRLNHTMASAINNSENILEARFGAYHLNHWNNTLSCGSSQLAAPTEVPVTACSLKASNHLLPDRIP